jgi:hypothetical protein
MALGGAVAEPQGQLLGVVAVVGDLLDGLRREGRALTAAGRGPPPCPFTSSPTTSLHAGSIPRPVPLTTTTRKPEPCW